jgi:phosphatidate cytidylyltransferase
LHLSSTVFGLVYVALLLQYLVRLLTPSNPDPIGAEGRLFLCIWLIVAAKLCDTGALLTGLVAGRHPMAPQISPKKTWEGAVGGIVVSMGVSYFFALLFRAHLPPFFTPVHAAALAAPIAAIAIVSDLIESIIKRQAEFKDSGTAIPGIGGIFDVSDSLLLVAPVGYFLLGLR